MVTQNTHKPLTHELPDLSAGSTDGWRGDGNLHAGGQTAIEPKFGKSQNKVEMGFVLFRGLGILVLAGPDSKNSQKTYVQWPAGTRIKLTF